MSLLVRASRQSRVCVNLEIEERNYSKQDQYFCSQVRTRFNSSLLAIIPIRTI